jgi:hypothetical protein
LAGQWTRRTAWQTGQRAVSVPGWIAMMVVQPLVVQYSRLVVVTARRRRRRAATARPLMVAVIERESMWAL